MEAAYVGVNLWARSVADCQSVLVKKIRRALLNQRLRAPEGEVRVDADTQPCSRLRVLGAFAATAALKLFGPPLNHALHSHFQTRARPSNGAGSCTIFTPAGATSGRRRRASQADTSKCGPASWVRRSLAGRLAPKAGRPKWSQKHSREITNETGQPQLFGATGLIEAGVTLDLQQTSVCHRIAQGACPGVERSFHSQEHGLHSWPWTGVSFFRPRKR
jgi:hypothetical protein